MNVGTIKLLCWLASFVMATALTLGAGHFMTHMEEHSRPVRHEYLEGVLQEDLEVQVDVHEGLDYKGQVYPTFVSMNWTGKPEPKPVKVQAEAPGPQKVQHRPMADLLHVLMIRQDQQNPGGSLASVVLLDGKNQPLDLHVGDALPAPHGYALVHAIHPDGVEFAFTDERPNETVTTGSLPQDLIVRVADDEVRIPSRQGFPNANLNRQPRAESTQLVAKNHYLLGQQDLDQFQREYSRILTEDVSLRTYTDADGKRAGIEVTSVKQGSIAARHGAQTGDVIVSINGQKVNSEQEAIQYVKNHSDEYDVWTVEVLRLGKLETVVYNSK